MRRIRISSIAACLMAAILVLSLFLNIMPAPGFAADADCIRGELDALKDKAAEIDRQQEQLQQKIDSNASEVDSVLAEKRALDQQIKLIHDEINNVNAQIQVYNQLIAGQQQKLDEAIQHQNDLMQQYSTRIRAMEKNSHKSYWSVLFEADSFTDFLGDLHMMAEIAKADQEMMGELEAVALEIQAVRSELTSEKADLNAQRASLAENQAELDDKTAQASLLLDELNDNAAEMQTLMEEYERREAELSASIAAKEKEYTDALQTGNNGSSSGWLYPLPYRVPITDAYGWRNHVITGKYSFHHGVDFAAGRGTAIYASRSGMVTDASEDDIYGFHVTINHGDGYSTLYAHMTHYVVSPGTYVEQGQIIGYVGSTGLSSGPHLHFSIYYNGNSVNPMDYV